MAPRAAWCCRCRAKLRRLFCTTNTSSAGNLPYTISLMGVKSMDHKRLVTFSKFLSKHLRHQPEALELTLADGGWVEVEALLAACEKHGFPITRAQLDEVVRTSDKKRFAFDETNT